MKKSSLLLHGLASALGAFAYISLVSWFMMNAERFLGQEPRDMRGPMLFLTLFVFSALITSLTVLGRPAYLFFTGAKKEAIQLLGYTTAYLFLLLILAFFLFTAN